MVVRILYSNKRIKSFQNVQFPKIQKTSKFQKLKNIELSKIKKYQ